MKPFNIEKRALRYAERAHTGQSRKYTGIPYITHPIAVAGIVKSVKHTPEMIAAALLHDVVEDTTVTIDAIKNDFGPVVARMVSDVTDVSLPSHGNRAMRKRIDRQHAARTSNASQTIKLADILDNLSSIAGLDPKFALVYMREKKLLVDVLKWGDPALRGRAYKLIDAYYHRFLVVPGSA